MVMENEEGGDVDDVVKDETKEWDKTMIMDKVRIMIKTKQRTR